MSARGNGRRHPTRRFPGRLGARPDRAEERRLDALAREAAAGKSTQQRDHAPSRRWPDESERR